jgi:hypothetical protein
MNIRRVTATLGLPVLLMGGLSTSAAATGEPAPGPAVVKQSVYDSPCDKIRFGPAQPAVTTDRATDVRR